MATLFDLSRITVYKKKKRKKKKTKSRRQVYADKLNENLPASEVWFQTKWATDIQQDKLDLYTDKFNEPLGSYIPDVINRGFKYIIEIDGSIHDTPEQQYKDRKKDAYYLRRGYQVFRIKAYCNISYSEALINISLLRASATRQY